RLLLKHGYRELAEIGGGAFVFTGSVSGIQGAQRHAAYGAHKAALHALVKSAAVEFGPVGIRVNVVAPGITWTPRIAARIGDDRKNRLARSTPLGEFGEP